MLPRSSYVWGDGRGGVGVVGLQHPVEAVVAVGRGDPAAGGVGRDPDVAVVGVAALAQRGTGRRGGAGQLPGVVAGAGGGRAGGAGGRGHRAVVVAGGDGLWRSRVAGAVVGVGRGRPWASVPEVGWYLVVWAVVP